MPDDPAYEAGMRVRREVLGDAYVDRATAGATDLTRDWQAHITRTAWGSVWTDDTLDRKTRSAITLAVSAALGRDGEVAIHVRGAINNGVTPAELVEVFRHMSVYAGVPAANHAIKIAEGVLGEIEDEARAT